MNSSKTLTEQVAAKASEFIDHFERVSAQRDGGKSNIYTLRKNAPPDLMILVREAHGDFLPDDFRYETILDALYALAECSNDLDEARLEADIDYSDLLKWVSSGGMKRIAYCDAAKDEFSLQDADIMILITYGQQMEKDEVLNSVRQSLIEICEREDYEESE